MSERCIKMIGTSVCYVSLFLLIEQFIRSRRSLFFRLMLTFSCCLHGFLRDQNFQTDRIPLTDITVLLNELWAFWPSMNVVDLRNDKSGSVDLLTSATNGSQPRKHDGVPQTTHQTVKLLTVLLPLFADTEQQCRQLQEIRTCRTSESRQPLLCCSLSATSFTLTPPTPESSSSSSPVDHSEPLHRESLRPSGDAWVVPPPDVALFLTTRYINGVSHCVVFPGLEDPCCSCSCSTRGSTSLALIPPTPESSSSSSPVDHSQPLHRESLRTSGDAWIVPPPDVSLFLTMRYINGVSRCVVFLGSEDPCCSSSFSTRGGTSVALIPSTLVDSETGGGRLRVSDTDQPKFRCLRLGRMSVCVRKCRRIRSQLRISDAQPVMYRPTETDHPRFQKKRRRRSCCPVLLCSSPLTRDVGVVTFFPM